MSLELSVATPETGKVSQIARFDEVTIVNSVKLLRSELFK